VSSFKNSGRTFQIVILLYEILPFSTQVINLYASEILTVTLTL